MDKVFAIQNGMLYVNKGGWHTCIIVDGAVVIGEPVKSFKPREHFNAYEIAAKCGNNFGIAAKATEEKAKAEGK